jgi:4-amino-4-deoxy-L-arabinose transferase-like glycosyltransferase
MPAAIPPNPDKLQFVARHPRLIALALVLAATLRITATYSVFSHTSDEPAHIACGMEWLSRGSYQLEEQHPPLTRVLAALGPFLDGGRSAGNQDLMAEGLLILRGMQGESYEKRLTLSRLGILPFFWLASIAVFLFGTRILGPTGAVFAVFVFTMLPVVLAHSGLATTDIGATAFFSLSLYCLFALLELPSLKRSVLLGFSLAGMVLVKLSTLAFFPASAAVCAFVFWRRNRAAGSSSLLASLRPGLWPASMAATFAVLLIWAAYRFSFGAATYFSFPVPFPELFEGLRQVAEHNERGHLSYFLGSTSTAGSWLFFPTLLAVKTPLSVLVLAAVALFVPRSAKQGWPGWLAWAAIAGVLSVAMAARINIGLRHVLPMMPFLSLVAASGALALWERAVRSRLQRDAALACLLLLALSSLSAHPDYLPYFNLLAGEHPEKIAVDSDLDWGQDIKRLGLRLKELGAPGVAYSPLIFSDLKLFGFPPRGPIDPLQPMPGINAVSLTQLKLDRLYLPANQPTLRPWPENYPPAEIVGKTILLYSFKAGP